MKYTKIDEKLAVAPQISIDDVAQIAALGYGLIVCNRPDGEDVGQPEFSQIKSTANAAGLQAIYQPITPPTLTVEAAKQFGAQVAASDTPVFAYCRTGTRCVTLWAINKCEAGADIDELSSFCENLGYGVSGALSAIK